MNTRHKQIDFKAMLTENVGIEHRESSKVFAGTFSDKTFEVKRVICARNINVSTPEIPATSLVKCQHDSGLSNIVIVNCK